MNIAIQEQMDIAIKKTRKPWPKASVRLLIHSAVMAMSMAMSWCRSRRRLVAGFYQPH